MHIPGKSSDINLEWIKSALVDQQEFRTDKISGFTAEVIGEGIGFMGEVIKLVLEYSDDVASNQGRTTGDDNLNVILKLPTQSSNRGIGEITGVYEREVRFYSELQAQLTIRTPTPFQALMDPGDDPEKLLALLRFINRLPVRVIGWLFWLGRKLPRAERDYALLLEDMSHLRAGNQVNGCSTEDAKIALKSMAVFHAQYWNNDAIEQIPWVIPLNLSAKIGHAVFQDCLPRYIEANKSSLKPGHLELLDWLNNNATELILQYTTLPSTLLHGDFRLDNIFFDDEKKEIVLCDWQTLSHGPGALDLAYFLSASMDNNADEVTVTQLIEYYRAQLANHGIQIDRETLEWAYQAGMLIILHRVIPAEYQDMLELVGDRGHQLAITWIERVLQKLEHVELDEIL